MKKVAKPRMKFILLVELPSTVISTKRQIITRELKKMSYAAPKRNVFLLELESEEVIQSIKDKLIRETSSEANITYYRLAD